MSHDEIGELYDLDKRDWNNGSSETETDKD